MAIDEYAPANNVAAIYNRNQRVLYLYADGEIPGYSRDVYFTRLEVHTAPQRYPVFGLKMWSDFGIPESKPYMCFQPFSSPFPSDGKVTIITKNHPYGITVAIDDDAPVNPDGTTKQPIPVATASLPAAPSNGDVVASLDDPLPIPMFVRQGDTFELSERIPGASFGIVDVEYDDKMLRMVGASYRNGQIYWKFRGDKVGYTTVVINVWDIPGLPKTRKVIISVEERLQSVAPVTAPATLPAVAPPPGVAVSA